MEILRDTPLLTLFIIIAAGLLLGSIRIKGLSLGASGVIFSSLLFGMLGCTIPAAAHKVGLVLFVYAVGISAGHGFFRVFASQGARFAKLALVVTASGAAIAGILAMLWQLSPSLATGIFAGSLTSTPALAAALDIASDPGAVSVGYGIAYPIGAIGVVLFVQFFPRMLRIDLQKKASERHASEESSIIRILAEVRNPMLTGRKITDIHFLESSRCRLLRYLEGDRLVPVTPETTLTEGMHVLVIGDKEAVPDVIDFLGKKSTNRFFIDSDTRKKLVVTSPNVVGKSLKDLNTLPGFGITVSRISRYGVEFIPSNDTVIQPADILTAVGPRENIQAFQIFAGHQRRVLNETDLTAVAVGIGVGILLGMVPITFPGTRGFTLGLAGGPLLAGLVMAHFGRIGRIRGYIPPAARRMMMNLGLVLFLAGAGIAAGGQVFDILRSHGVTILAMSVIVTFIPMLIGFVFARKVLKLEVLEVLGGITGGMTSTPGLGAVNDAVDSEIPAMSYAAVYPVSLIFMTLFSQLLLRLLNI
jgi:putative transport protein